MHVSIEFYENQPDLYCSFCNCNIKCMFYKFFLEQVPFNLHPECFENLKKEFHYVLTSDKEK